MSSLFRDDLDAIPAYIPGRSIPGAIKISSNEVTDAPDQSIIDAVATAVAGGNRYPDTSSKELRTAIAAALTQDLCARASLDNASDNASSGEGDDNAVTGATETTEITPEQIVVGNGSVSLLQHLVQAACPAGSNLVMPWRSFEAYPIMGYVAQATLVQVPNLPNGKHDLAALAAAAQDPNTGMVLLCNPNNPTGETFTHAELVTFLDAIPSNVLVALDEAYYHYNRTEDFPRSLELLSSYPNLVVLRTFSKAYGLAGFRVGYFVGSEEACSNLSKTVIPFSTSLAAQAAARAALTIRDQLLARTDAIVAERERVTKELRAMGFQVDNSQANFVWLPRSDAQQLIDYLIQRKVIIRGFPGEGIRVTIATPEENTQFLNVIADYPAIRPEI